MIICGGLIVADLVLEIAEFPVKGTKTRSTAARLIPGGGALNAASAIASLGGNACLAGAIGDDIFGTFLRQKITERGIDDQYVTTVAGAGTSCSAVLIDPDKDRTLVNHRDAAVTPNDFTLPSPFPFDAALVDTRSPEAAARVMQAARHAQVPAVIDAEAPVAEAQQALSLATHVVFSEQGLADYIGNCDAPALEKAALQLGTWCAVTRGALSVLCHDGQNLTEVPAYPATAMNTLGAGDVWHGAFTLALAKGLTEISAVQWANAVASLMVRRSVMDETLPTTPDVDKFMLAQTAV